MSKPEVFEVEDLLAKNRGLARYSRFTQYLTGKKTPPIRVWICLMIFFTTYINYTTRVNLSLSIASMTYSKTSKIPECKKEDVGKQSSNNSKPAELPDYGPRYDWDQTLQGQIIASYFVGYVVTSLPAGWFAESVGPYRTIFWAHMITAVLNFLCVVGTWTHFAVLIALRFLIGACAGLVYPALQCMIARWAPPAEKGKFVSALMGNTLGTCITWPLLGTIIQNFGWDWGFYFLSIQIFVFCIIFGLIAADSPDTHKWITEEEKSYIAEAQGGTVNKKKVVPPYKEILTSCPFWALCIIHFGNLWGLYLQLTGVPKFMTEVVGFDLKSSGGLAALPHIARLFLGFGFGTLGDYMKKREVSTKFVRKFFVLFSHILPGVAMMCIPLFGCQWVPMVILLIISQSLNGAAVLTNLQNPQDLAPNFAGSIFGIISFVGGLSGFLTPSITGALTKENNGIKEWGYNFLIGGSVYMFCGLTFIIFGSVERQPWNEKKDES